MLKKKSNFSLPNENSTDDTDSDFENHGKDKRYGYAVHQQSWKSLTKTVRTGYKQKHMQTKVFYYLEVVIWWNKNIYN